jgi:hypothetical protein
MSRSLQRCVAISLAFCLLLLSGLIYAQTVPHTFHHARHQATTHATVLCSWLCAAGQVLDGTPVVVQAGVGPVSSQQTPLVSEPLGADLPTTPARGPPSPFF